MNVLIIKLYHFALIIGKLLVNHYSKRYKDVFYSFRYHQMQLGKYCII